MMNMMSRRWLLSQRLPDVIQREECYVRWWDYKGNIIKEQWVSRGGSVKHPFHPMLEYDFLKFYGWTHTEEELSDIQHDYDVLAYYDTARTNGRHPLCIKVDASAGQQLTFTLASTFTGPNTYGIDWGDGSRWDGDSGENNVSLTASHTYESDFSGWVVFDNGIGCTVGVKNSDDIIKEVHGLSSSSWNYNYGLSSVSDKHIDYITFGKSGLSGAPYGGLNGITTKSPLFSTRYGTINGTSFPAYYAKGVSGHNASVYNVSGIDKVIGTSGVIAQAVLNLPDLVYSYIPKSVTSTYYFFDSCPNLEVIEIEEGWYPRKDIDLSVFPKLKEDGFKRFLTNLGTTSTTRTLTISENMQVWLSADEIASVEAKGYMLTTISVFGLRRTAEATIEEDDEIYNYPFDEKI